MEKKSRAIHAELRKESVSFNGWLKYEVTIEHSNGEIEKIPAYGKDLQDALSRVVHDKKIQKLAKAKIPVIAGVFLGTLIAVSFGLIGINQEKLGSATGPVMLGTIAILSTLTISILNWFTLQNTAK